MSGTEWLSESAEDFLARYLEPKPLLDVVIIGSGYGGAVAAARLAQHDDNGRPLQIHVLERGKEYVPGDFPERLADLPGYVRLSHEGDAQAKGFRDGLFDLRLGREVSALVGNGLGGGSLINAGVMAEPTQEVLGQNWPQALARKDVWKPYYERVRGMLGARKMPLPTDQSRSVYAKPSKLAALELLGNILEKTDIDRRAEIAVTFEAGTTAGGVRQQACIQCGDCFTGCNHWAKNTLAMNYLPYAKARGVQLVTGITVLSLSGEEGDWELKVTLTDPDLAKKYLAKADGTTMHIRARRVILAAGTYGSTEILLRSNTAGQFSTRLGERFSTNGDMIAAGYKLRPLVNACARESQPPDSRNVGPTITGLLDLRAGRPLGEQIAIEEMAAPAALRRMLEETVTNVDAMQALGRVEATRHDSQMIGQDPAAIDAVAVERTALYAIMGHDDATGRMQLVEPDSDKSPGAVKGSSDGAIRITRGAAARAIGDHPIFQYGIDRLRSAHADPRLGGSVLPNPLWDPWPEALAGLLDRKPRKGPALTVHPLGGCAAADRAEDGVVNDMGQVYRGAKGNEVYASLVVLDGSVVPTSLGINPALTIAAFAERAVDRLKEAWDLRPSGETVTPALPEPLGAGIARPHTGTRPTAFRFSEKLDSSALRLPVGIRHAHAPYEWIEFKRGSLHLEFTPVPDLQSMLSALPKVMTLDAAVLTLSNDDDEPLHIPLKGYMSLLEQMDSTLWRRTVRGLWAWLLNRGPHDIWMGVRQWLQGDSPGIAARRAADNAPTATLWQRALQLIRMAGHAGERRRYRYEFIVTEDISHASRQYFAAGDRLIGEKTIAYQWRSNPWRQWMEMDLYVHHQNRCRRQHLGVMTVDLPYYVKAHAIQLQLTDQDSQPQAIADLISFATYTARIFGKIHVWSFRAPDYPDSLIDSDANTDRWKLRAQFDRLPGQVAGATRTRLTPPDQRYLLHRYRPAHGSNAQGPVLLVHGFGASGSSFTLPSVPVNLVEHLTTQGFDTFVLDLRTSIALRSSNEEWSFEDVAREDLAHAIKQVHMDTGGKAVNVIAHCIGAAMFCMAALDDRIERSWIRAVVLSQLGPLVELTALNTFRGYIAANLKYFLMMQEFDVTAARNDVMDIVDRLLTTYPYPKADWFQHHSMLPWKTIRHEVFCTRASAIYNPLFEHDNLNHATLDAFPDLIGHVNLHTYVQTLYFATKKRLTDHLGRNTFVTQDRITRSMNYPICFLHGEKNQLFTTDTSRKSFELVSGMFSGQTQWSDDANHATRGAYRLEIVPGYGHQDSIIGKRASQDVFARMTDFLRAPPADDFVPSARLCAVRAPRLGPILGWTRRDPDGMRRAAITFVPDDELSRPVCAVSIVSQGARFTSATFRHIQRHPLEVAPLADGSLPPPLRIDVDLPDGADCTIAVVTLHSEPDIAGMRTLGLLPPEFLQHEDLSMQCEAIAQMLMPMQQQIECGASDARVVDAQYDFAPPCVHLAAHVMDTMDIAVAQGGASVAQRSPARSLSFAAGSCRYAAMALDREMADRTFGRLRQRLDSADTNSAKPQLLLLTGDQIYADATAGLFDPSSPLDRYDNQYLEVWSAPNMRQILSRLPTYMMLDDHEIRDNWEETRIDQDARMALRAFQSYQLKGAPPNPSGPRGLTEAPFRHWYAFESGGYGFFVLDTRTDRRHQGLGHRGGDEHILGPEQWQDLEDWFRAQDRQRPKFIVSPSVVAPWSKATGGSAAHAVRSDAWDGFPRSLNRLLGFIAQEGIDNVIFISGDYHCSLVCDMEITSGDSTVRALSIVSSGLYAPYPFINGTPDEFELDHDGDQRRWARSIGAFRSELAPLTVRYRTRRDSFVTSASIAVVSVEPGPDDAAGRIVVEFLAEQGVLRESILLA